MKIATHSCGVRWRQWGNATSHCAGCHRTFTSTRGFELHRINIGGRRGCADPATKAKKDGTPMFARRIDAAGCEVWEHITAVADRFGKSGQGHAVAGQ